MMLLLLITILISSYVTQATNTNHERYTEQLHIQPILMPNTNSTISGDVLFSFIFEFRRILPTNGDDVTSNFSSSFEFFPRSIANMMNAGVWNFDFTSTRGMWEMEWGLPPFQTHGGSRGMELSAIVDSSLTFPSIHSRYSKSSNSSNGNDGENQAWTRLVRTLSGLTCSSLSQVQYANVLAKIPSIHQFGKMTHNKSEPLTRNRILAQLPSETTCTENLSSLLKLLPCRTRAGLAQAIIPQTLITSRYYSLSMSSRRICLDHHHNSNNKNHHPDLDIDTVDPWHSQHCKIKGLSFIESIHFLRVDGMNKSISTLLSSGNNNVIQSISSCPASEETNLVVYDSQLNSTFSNTWKDFTNYSQTLFAMNNLSSLLNTTAATNSNINNNKKNRNHPLRISRWISTRTGIDSPSGTLSTVFQLHHQQENTKVPSSLNITHVEILPSFLRPRLTSIQVQIGKQHILSRSELISIMDIVPTRVRGPPTTLYFRLSIPATEIVTIRYEFDKEFLNFEEFPANPNRGFDIPSALTTFKWIDSSYHTIASDALLISLPMPDFSMPYNVITLSCTAFSFFLGSFINATARVRDDNFAPVVGGNSRLGRLRLIIGKIFHKVLFWRKNKRE
jgi:phosphatidylinositol glycan class T